MDSVEASLERLQTDHIDLYQIHGTDTVTPIEETLRALDDLVSRGMVRYVGVSNWQAWRIAKALGISDRKGFARFETVQAYYSIAGRDLEREIVPLLQEEKLGLMVWSPLAGGLLSGKYGPGAPGNGEGRRATFNFPPVDKDRAWASVAVMREIAGKHGASVATVALAYVLAKPFVMSVIIGASRMDQLDQNLAATKLKLDADDLQAGRSQRAAGRISRLDAGAPSRPAACAVHAEGLNRPTSQLHNRVFLRPRGFLRFIRAASNPPCTGHGFAASIVIIGAAYRDVRGVMMALSAKDFLVQDRRDHRRSLSRGFRQPLRLESLRRCGQCRARRV